MAEGLFLRIPSQILLGSTQGICKSALLWEMSLKNSYSWGGLRSPQTLHAAAWRGNHMELLGYRLGLT